MEKPSLIMEKFHNLIAGATGSEQIGFLDTSKQSLYGKSRPPHDLITKLPYQWCLLTATTAIAASIAFNPLFWNVVAQSGTQLLLGAAKHDYY